MTPELLETEEPLTQAFAIQGLNAWYGSFHALKGVSMSIPEKRVTAIIGPSGCGKSTLIRCLNRINDLISGFRVEGQLYFKGKDLYDPALDPIATGKIEELIYKLKEQYTVVIVTHNMQQAARVSDFTGFLLLGDLVEFGPTGKIFTNPADSRTEAYITGRFG